MVVFDGCGDVRAISGDVASTIVWDWKHVSCKLGVMSYRFDIWQGC